MFKFIPKYKLDRFIYWLSSQYSVYAPIKIGEDFQFKQLEESSIVHLGVRTNFSLKNFVLPSCQKLFDYSKDRIIPYIPSEKKALLGVQPHDINAFNLLDKIMLRPIEDSLYRTNRSSLLIIQFVGGEEEERKVLANPSAEGGDLLMIETDENYYFYPYTSEGKKAISDRLFQSTSLKLVTQRLPLDPFLQRKKEIAEAIRGTKNHKVWDKWAKKCIGCGNCVFVCPLCYCFDVQDRPNPDGESGQRERVWDSCFYQSFAQTNSHNYREEFRDRFYYWYHHKFVRSIEEHGFFNCIDCARCIEACPAGINFKKVLNEVLEIYQKEKND